MPQTALEETDAPSRPEGLTPDSLSVCPGCGGPWRTVLPEAAAAVCSRCGLERTDAQRLIWDAAAAAYHAARQAALEGRFGDARALLAPHRVASPEAIVLERLCTAVPPEQTEAAQASYAAARAAAARGDYTAAVRQAEVLVRDAPCLLSAQRLLLLALAAAGQTEAAERRRQELAQLLPGDPDLARWRFSGTAEAAVSAARRRIRRRTEVPPVRSLRRVASSAAKTEDHRPPRARRSPLALLTALLPPIVSAAALLLATAALLHVSRAPQPAPEKPQANREPLPSPAPFPLPAKEAAEDPPIAPALEREASERRAEADLAQARVWFNRAVRAKGERDWGACDRLAAAAYHLAPNSYLADESLLLRAQAAEDRGDIAVAAARYATIAGAQPRSRYAAWALGHAAWLARRAGQPALAARCRRDLLRRYPASSTARAARSDAAATEERPASVRNTTADDGGVSRRVDG